MSVIRNIGTNICVLVLSAFVLSACASSVTPHEEFLDLLDYEAQNRAFAHQSVNRMVAKTATKEVGPFWQAYADLEALNKAKYKPFLEKYKIAADARWTTQARGWAGSIVGNLFPETAIDIMQQATVAYVPKLRRLADLAPKDENDLENLKTKRFFAFVVAQEEVQAEAMRLLGEAQIAQAAAHITSFVSQYSKASKNVEAN